MKKCLSIFLVYILCILMMPVEIGASTFSTATSPAIVIDNTKGEKVKTYTLDTALCPGEFAMLEYTYTAKKANEEIYAEISWPYTGDSWRPVSFMTDGSVGANRLRWSKPENDRNYIDVGAVSEGETYHIVGIMKVGTDGTNTFGRIYLNGELVSESKYIALNIATGDYKSINVSPGVRAVFTKLTDITKLNDFNYSDYQVRLASSSSEYTVSDSDYANFTLTLSGENTVATLKEKLTVPQGAELTFIHNGRILSEDAIVLEGTNIFVQSKNKRQAIVYRVTGGILPFATTYTTDHTKGVISGVADGTAITAFKDKITVTEGFSIDGVYRGEEEVENGYISSAMCLRIKNGGSILEYSLSVENEPTDGAIISKEYFIDYSNKQINGILKYTPVSALLEKLVCGNGVEILGIYNREEQITDKIEKDTLTLRIKSNGVTEEYRLKLANSIGQMKESKQGYYLDGISGKVIENTVSISGKISQSYTEKAKTISFYEPHSEENGDVLNFSDDGNMYFWGHLLGKWETDREYNYAIITDTNLAEARVYIDGKKVLEHIYVPFFAGVKNPIYLSSNFNPGEDFEYVCVFPDGVKENEEKVYNDNFKIVSENILIKDDTIYIASDGYTAQELLDNVTATRGSYMQVYAANATAVNNNENITDGMYVIVKRENREKRYNISTLSKGIVPTGTVKLYRNEISESGLLNDKKDIPVLSDKDTLIIVAYVSNFDDQSVEAGVYAAGYDENGNLIEIGVGHSEIAANTDGAFISTSLTSKQLEGVHSLGVFLWDESLVPLLNTDIHVKKDESRLSEYECRDEAPNMITSALVKPNYKGLIFEENGENDIRLMMRINEISLPDEKTLEDYRVKIVIADTNENVVLQSAEETITEKMNVTFSSKHLKLGDYVLKASLIDKAALEEIDYNIWTLRKRNGDISELSSYVDENGRYIKDGKPKFYIGMYGSYYSELEQIDLFKDNGIDGIFLFWPGSNGTYSDEWLDKMNKSGMDLFANMSLFKEVPDDKVNFKLNSNSDERQVIEQRMNALANHPAVAGYYVGDERPPQASDKLRWHSDIVSSLDIEKPTFYMDYRGGDNAVFLHNASADIMGLDHYPVTRNQDDVKIGTVATYTKDITENFINKPVWMALQCHNVGLWDENITEMAQTPTEKQQRNMAMQAVCNEATGIWWYSYDYILNEAELDSAKKPDVAARVEQNTDANELLGRTLSVSRLFSKWGDIIMSEEEAPDVSVKCSNSAAIQSIVKRYQGKTYLFAANTTVNEETAVITVSGAKKVKNIYTGESYQVDNQGSFTAVFENIGIAVFEIEQNEFLSHDSAIKNISFFNNTEQFVITYDDNGNIVLNLPKDIQQINYDIDISDKAKLYINGTASDCKGILNGDNILFKVVAEDKAETSYRVLINNK